MERESLAEGGLRAGLLSFAALPWPAALTAVFAFLGVCFVVTKCLQWHQEYWEELDWD